MIWFKSCPKCLAGDLEEKSDGESRYLRCVQCGKHFESQGSPSNEVLNWTRTINSTTDPIRFSIKDAYSVYQARAAKSLGYEAESTKEVNLQRL